MASQKLPHSITFKLNEENYRKVQELVKYHTWLLEQVGVGIQSDMSKTVNRAILSAYQAMLDDDDYMSTLKKSENAET